MKISKEEKEVMGVLEDLVSSTLADSDGCLLFKTDYEEPLKSIHKIYKPLLEDLKAENDRLKEGYEKDTKLIYHADDVIPKLETKIATLKELVEDRTKDIQFYDEENKELKTTITKLRAKLYDKNKYIM